MQTLCPSPGLRSEATIGRILRAAESLFLSRTYADVRMDDIAAHADVTKGALYHHFSGKDELYADMVTRDLRRKQALFEEAIGRFSGCRERLAALTAAFFALPREERELIQLVRRDRHALRGPLRSRIVRCYQAALPHPVEQVLRDGMKSGEILRGDARILAWQFIALVEVTLHRRAESVLTDDETRLRHLLDLFFHGACGKRPKESK